jgi:SEC-C motif-containing protein
MKISVNSPCPCGSGKKYKKCCQIYHKGALAPNALTLMKSRYSAYYVGEVNYIIKTTHVDNPLYEEDKVRWKKELEIVSRETIWQNLKIIEFKEIGDNKSSVSFIASFEGGKIEEKSFFVKEQGVWKYYNYEILVS